MSRHQQPPHFAAALEMMHSRNPQTQEDGFAAINARAGEHVDELLTILAEKEASGDQSLRGWLLELLGEAADLRALPVFRRYLDDVEHRLWAVRGLEKLDTKEARRVLWEAGESDRAERG